MKSFGMWSDLFGWPSVWIAISFLLASGGIVVSVSPQLTFVRCCLSIAAAVLASKLVWWIAVEHPFATSGWMESSLFVFVVFGVVAAFWSAGMRWLDGLEASKAGAQVVSQPLPTRTAGTPSPPKQQDAPVRSRIHSDRHAPPSSQPKPSEAMPAASGPPPALPGTTPPTEEAVLLKESEKTLRDIEAVSGEWLAELDKKKQIHLDLWEQAQRPVDQSGKPMWEGAYAADEAITNSEYHDLFVRRYKTAVGDAVARLNTEVPGVVNPTREYDPQSPAQMDEVVAELRSLAEEYKAKLQTGKYHPRRF